ncbi:DNA-binding protein [Brucella endophytica]|uniref:DNA-binding protein n=1 Tax=Brucella endophytica TaxID=1963359 RepID=A0A916S0N7_9HYPH|nr:helix-turn-helix transcriptional regulator [Brucella endophytica]GGA78988.1 DNA-binding protein [Brucella endophytica]
MISHERVWAAIDALAERYSLTPSGLARRGGLDPTTFNKSKRYAADGRARWPSTESLAKVMEATGASLDELMELMREGEGTAPAPAANARAVPFLSLAQAGSGNFFDDAGFPTGQGWDVLEFPPAGAVYALEVSGDSMLPFYRDGNTLIVAPGASIRRGDHVLLKTKAGEVTARILHRQTPRAVELLPATAGEPNRILDAADVAWLARIIWASQ